MRRALELLVTRLDAADEVFFAVFNERVAAASWTQDHLGLLREFDAAPTRWWQCVAGCRTVDLAHLELGRYQRKVLLLITDGNDGNVAIAGVMPSEPTMRLRGMNRSR